MIRSFKSKETEKIWNGVVSKKLPPSNRLEMLKGKLKGWYSIRINEQWRICFKWENANCYNVEIIDYH
ncbi:type II toxin-antitoxin system RelE/ParE family toxin [bacterium]|nr:type II toxin-antitoxin system RelE/ParE family toxin [bacterium]